MKKTISLFLALLLLPALAVPALAAEELPFSDVPQNEWYAGYVEQAVRLGFIDGDGSGRFNPDSDVTYAHFAAMMCKLSYRDEVSTTIAAPGSPWWMPYCVVASRHSLFRGTPMSNERNWSDWADEPVSRSDMAMMAYNYLLARGRRVLAAASLSSVVGITDISGLDELHTRAVVYCFALKVLRGTGEGSFSPSGTMTRAQAAKVLCETYEVTTRTTQPYLPYPILPNPEESTDNTGNQTGTDTAE